MAFQIIRHAFSMIFGNLGQALRVSVGPYLLLILAIVGVLTLAGFPGGYATYPESSTLYRNTLDPVAAVFVFLVVVFSVFVFGWVAVAWHRFILLEEYSGLLPKSVGLPIWRYIGLSLVLALIMFCLMFLVGFAVGAIVSIVNALRTSLGLFMIEFMMTSLASYLWFRLAIVLPAIATNNPLSIGEAWRRTGEIGKTVLAVAVALVAMNLVIQETVFTLFTNDPTIQIIQLVLQLITMWLMLMVGLSILTTIYGHLIEKRPLIE